MNAKLIADAGSTKVEWLIVPSDGAPARRFVSDGINSLLADDSHILRILHQVKEFAGYEMTFEEVNFYGAGCATEKICSRILKLIKDTLPADNVSVASDLLAAARALLQKETGIACILGTGSNSCLYDGNAIKANIPSLGFILGDDGSGAALGKRLVSDAFKGFLPSQIAQRFNEAFGFTLPEILEKVYRFQAPNRFLASVVPFIKDNIGDPYLHALVLDEFSVFLRRNVVPYPEAESLKIGFIGSIAVNFENILKEAAGKNGLTIGNIMKSPIEGLLRYHAY